MEILEKLDPKSVLFKAFYRAGHRLGLTFDEMEKILTLNKNPSENAVNFIRMYRFLLGITNSENHAKRWLNSENNYFGETPRCHIQKNNGLATAVVYLAPPGY